MSAAHALEVWLDGDLGPPCLVGTLAHARGQIRFRYERAWLRDARAFALDPDLSLDPDAQFLRAQGDGAHTATDLEQLFRRVAFNVAVGNRDDHLRNHGFVLGEKGWRLAPAFDVNPNIDKAEHVLNIDDADNRPSLTTVMNTAPFYGLGEERGQQIVEEVASAVDGWEDAARQAGIDRGDVALSAGAFSAHMEYRSVGR